MEPDLLRGAVEVAGTPVWVFNLDRVSENARALSEAAGEGSVSYAIKANDHPAILGAVKRSGIGAEAASGREYSLAREAGFAGQEITFNGPLKTEEDLQVALGEGALVNADSPEEVGRILDLAEGNVRVGFRVQMNLIEGAVGDRFGLTSEQARESAKLLRDRHVPLAQLHAHLVSYAVKDIEGPTSKRVDLIWPRSPALTAALAARLIAVARDLAGEGSEPASISLGGGLPTMPDASAHIAEAKKQLAASGLSSRLAFEPGRAVVSNAAALVCRVVQVRGTDRDGRQQVVVDAGVNLLHSVEWRDAELSALDGRPGSHSTTVFGPLCLQSDVLAWRAWLPQLQPGDLLVAENVGAYNWVRSAPFIFPRAPVVLVDNGSLRVSEGR